MKRDTTGGRGVDRNQRRGQHRAAVGPTRRGNSSHYETIILRNVTVTVIIITLTKFAACGDVPVSVFRRRGRVKCRLRDGRFKPPLLFSRRQGWKAAESRNQMIWFPLFTSKLSKIAAARCVYSVSILHVRGTRSRTVVHRCVHMMCCKQILLSPQTVDPSMEPSVHVTNILFFGFQ